MKQEGHQIQGLLFKAGFYHNCIDILIKIKNKYILETKIFKRFEIRETTNVICPYLKAKLSQIVAVNCIIIKIGFISVSFSFFQNGNRV